MFGRRERIGPCAVCRTTKPSMEPRSSVSDELSVNLAIGESGDCAAYRRRHKPVALMILALSWDHPGTCLAPSWDLCLECDQARSNVRSRTHPQTRQTAASRKARGGPRNFSYSSSNKSMATKRHRRRKNGAGPTTEFPDFCVFLCLLVARKMATEFLNPL